MKKIYHVSKTFWNLSGILFGFVSTQIKKFGGKQIFFAFFKIFQNLGSNRKFFKCYNFTQPQCLLNILAWKLSKNWVKVIFVICMNRAIEKCAKLLFKSHRKLRNSQNKIFVRFFFAHPLANLTYLIFQPLLDIIGSWNLTQTLTRPT